MRLRVSALSVFANGTCGLQVPFSFCTAARAGAVGLCGMNNETIPDAETVLPKNLCPLIKGTYGFAPSPVAICK